MNRLLSRSLVALHSPSWRRRYGCEFTALIEDMPPSPALLLDGLRSVFDSWCIQRAHRIAVSAVLKLQAGLLGVIFCFALLRSVALNPPHFSVRFERAEHAAGSRTFAVGIHRDN